MVIEIILLKFTTLLVEYFDCILFCGVELESL